MHDGSIVIGAVARSRPLELVEVEAVVFADVVPQDLDVAVAVVAALLMP
jgi:hypothetical protein